LTHNFLFRGDINTVAAKLAGAELANFSAEEPDLEEIFLHYYTGEAQAQ